MSGSGCKGYGFSHNTASTNPSIDQGCTSLQDHPDDDDDDDDDDDGDDGDDGDDYSAGVGIVDLGLGEFNRSV